MSLPLFIALGGAAAIGGIIGALSRQPEINRLRKQIKRLQREIKRLQNMLSEQNRQINELKARYAALKIYQFSQKTKQKGKIKGYIMQQYALKEYIELCCKKCNYIEMSESEKLFFNTYENMLNGIEVEYDDKLRMRNFLINKYSYEINHLIPIDIEELLRKVRGTDV